VILPNGMSLCGPLTVLFIFLKKRCDLQALTMGRKSYHAMLITGNGQGEVIFYKDNQDGE
jgi:hypothetical protein